jgi:hypothetical protein
MALDRRPTYPLLERSKIIDRDHPTQPTATLRRACPDRLTERHFVGRRMIKNTDHLKIVSVRQRQDLIARAETRMESTIEKGHSELRPESPRCSLQTFRSGRERQVVQVHAHIVSGGFPHEAGGPGTGGMVRGLSFRVGRMSHGVAAPGLELRTHAA